MNFIIKSLFIIDFINYLLFYPLPRALRALGKAKGLAFAFLLKPSGAPLRFGSIAQEAKLPDAIEPDKFILGFAQLNLSHNISIERSSIWNIMIIFYQQASLAVKDYSINSSRASLVWINLEAGFKPALAG